MSKVTTEACYFGKEKGYKTCEDCYANIGCSKGEKT